MQAKVTTFDGCASSPNRLIITPWPIVPPDPEAWPNLWARCWARIRTWKVPPRWTPADWRDEARAQGALAACQALRDFRVDRGVPRSAFLYQKVVAAAWTRYRQEWAFGRRSRDLAPIHEGETPEPAPLDPEPIQRLARALDSLPEADRRLIVQLFREGRSEDELAAAFGISRQGVNKRKSRIIERLRSLLEDAA